MSIEIFEGDAAYANIVSAPANVLLYSGPGFGKSTDAVEAFTRDGRCSAFVIPCEDNALKAIPARGLPVPSHSGTVKTWGQMQEAIGVVAQRRGKYSAVIIDGLSALTSNLYIEAQERFKGGRNKFDIPVFVRNCLFQLREWIRMLGMHSILLGHFKAPSTEEGTFYPGGPLLQPASMIAVYFALVDTVLRGDFLYGTLPGAQPIRVYHTGGNVWPETLGPTYPPPSDWRSWFVKNREGVNHAVVPADLGAFLKMRQPPYGGL